MVILKLGNSPTEKDEGIMRLANYEVGRTLGTGSFAKVKLAKHVNSDQLFALKIIDKTKIFHLNIAHQITREIATLKLLKHPNVVRLHEVLASKTKIYLVLEYVTGGELFDRIASKGRLKEAEGRKLFQQLIDGVSYCHNKGVFHRDLKLENVLVDAQGNIKITDFGLSASPQHIRADGLLHTTCGSPCYVAPEVLANRGYEGATSDTWSCGVILFVILTGYLPFEDRNIAVLYQKISKGDVRMPKWLSSGAQNLLRRILDPNPLTRITLAGIKDDEWFQQDNVPANPEDEEEEKENDVSERKMRFTSNHSAKDLIAKIEDIGKEMGFRVQKKNGKLKVIQENKAHRSLGGLSVAAEVVEISASLHVVELMKSFGDSSVYRQLCKKLSDDLAVAPSQARVNSEVGEAGEKS
ncbi:CBL-interacting serine/threonine-protein kinase 1-like isoform X2 [Prosopis cineraria]|uniref:CBL-interacting serine/threonine-protein kinase 1-like isoform X2 n=1 Tax=Prosopis cineraria TaxID=364024 RepID=UPI002410916F|nr:CBL-interacting serine/threonine-protein kinase 1-like isoform X2 [Prosopis cineraria]